MVIQAYLDTNIRDVVQNQVDDVHKVRYRESFVTVKDNNGRDHVLNTSNGELWLIECYGRPIVNAITDNGIFNKDKFNPERIPGDFYLFPTIFELERLTREPIVVNGITRLISDITNDFSPEDSYFREQKAKLDTFVAAYARAVDYSHFGKPVLEGFYEAIREKNLRVLRYSENTERPEASRNAMRRLVYQEKSFIDVFGRNLYVQLRSLFGEPKFS
ncbi:hypothetical protein HYX11_02710 [Candidatus Woesearchaeota archaeon]|nr:hypothetical protein [Candidatus Woesearchaeota archaeon]